jgi:lambda repressor-like predicted transcriptional regulator
MLVVFGASALWSQGPRADVAAIIDVDAPVANAENSTRLRERALADAERDGHPVYFELTADAIRPVQDEARDSFRSSKLPIHPPPAYNGVSLSFTEAAEILRKNEAVRDTVIRRACPTSGECGAAVHAAALALTRDTEVASAAKLQHLANFARQQPATTLVLVTAGWPYRDEESLKLDAIVRDLRADGTTLTVLRVPATIVYGRLVKDASERITSRVAGTFIALNDDQDAERARRMLSARLRTAVKTPAPPPPTPSEAPAARDDGAASTPPGVLDEPLRRAADYVARFEETFSAVIWRERYHQEDRVPRKFNSSGTSFSTIAAQRKLDSDLLLVWLPGRRAGLRCGTSSRSTTRRAPPPIDGCRR